MNGVCGVSRKIFSKQMLPTCVKLWNLPEDTDASGLMFPTFLTYQNVSAAAVYSWNARTGNGLVDTERCRGPVLDTALPPALSAAFFPWCVFPRFAGLIGIPDFRQSGSDIPGSTCMKHIEERNPTFPAEQAIEAMKSKRVKRGRLKLCSCNLRALSEAGTTVKLKHSAKNIRLPDLLGVSCESHDHRPSWGCRRTFLKAFPK